VSVGSGFFRRFIGWLAFYFAIIVGIITFLRVFMISRDCILLDLYFMSEMRSRSVWSQKEYCTKYVHVQILYIIRVIQPMTLLRVVIRLYLVTWAKVWMKCEVEPHAHWYMMCRAEVVSLCYELEPVAGVVGRCG